MRVVFQKRKRNLCVWTAFPPKRRPVSAIGGGGLHGRLPHDLAQLIIERGLGYRNGFWGSVADGASFRSLVKGGRKRTAPGVAVIAAHVEEIDAAELDFHRHVRLWRQGEKTPFGAELARAQSSWRALPEHGTLELGSPSVLVCAALVTRADRADGREAARESAEERPPVAPRGRKP